MTTDRGVCLNRKLSDPSSVRKPVDHSVDGIYNTALQAREFDPSPNQQVEDALMLTYTPNGASQHLTVSNAAAGIPFAAFPTGTTDVQITIETAGVYVSQDGGAPTSSDLHLEAGQYITWPIEMAEAALWIRDGSVDASVAAQPLRRYVP